MFGADIPTLGAIKGKMRWNEYRHQTIASNVANINTPRYQAKDVARPDFASFLNAGRGFKQSLTAATTNDNHLPSRISTSLGFSPSGSGAWEVTASGNEVVSEQQMVKLSENATDYQISITLYSRSLAMLRSVLDRA